MTTYFVSRHPGSREWAASQGIVVDRLVEQLDKNQTEISAVISAVKQGRWKGEKKSQ